MDYSPQSKTLVLICIGYTTYLSGSGALDETEEALDRAKGVPIASLCLALLEKVVPNRPGDLDLLLGLYKFINILVVVQALFRINILCYQLCNQPTVYCLLAIFLALQLLSKIITKVHPCQEGIMFIIDVQGFKVTTRCPYSISK